MFRSWLRKMAKEELEAEFQTLILESSEALREKIDTDLRFLLQGAVAVNDDELTISSGHEYIPLDFTTEKPTILHGYLDLSRLNDGDAVGVDILVRWSDGELLSYKSGLEIKDRQTDPAFQIGPITCPRGGQIKIRHLAGANIPVRYYVVRRNP